MKLHTSQGVELAVDVDVMPLDRVALLPCKRAADVYFERIFPLFVSCVVASADREYPLQPELREEVFKRLTTDSKLQVVVFGYESLADVSVRSERILVLDDILLSSLIAPDVYWHPAMIPLDEGQVVTLMQAFLRQPRRRQHIGNYSFFYRYHAKWARDKYDWRADLVTKDYFFPKNVDDE